MSVTRRFILSAIVLTSLTIFGQTSGKTVRKYKTPVESPTEAALRDAESAIEKQNYDAAEKSLRDAIVKDSNNYRAWFDLGFVLNAKGQRAESIEAYRKAVASNPTIFESNLNLGLMLAREGNSEAVKYLRAATLLKPSSHPTEETARAWLALAHVLEKSDPKGAVEAFRSAATLKPKDVEPHLGAGKVLESIKDYNGAETEYKRAVELDPKSSEALAGLVDVYQQSGRLNEAETVLRKYIVLDPQNATAHAQLGRVLAATNKTDEAIAEFRIAIALVPDNAAAGRELADLLFDAKKYADAQAILAPVLQKFPNDPMLHYSMGRILMYQLNYSAAQNEFLAAINLKNDFGDAYSELAITANENKNYELALRALDARKKFLEETPATYFLRATIFDHLRDKKQAIEYYHLFLDAANGKSPDLEWKAKHRLIALEPKK